jgi:Glycosyl transferase family 2
MPTYNGVTFVGAAIRSVLDQSLPDFELIVVDDASTDATREVAASFADPRVTHHVNAVRRGLVGNWNRCLELARSQYVCVFHQDDVMQPENLAEKVAFLDRHATAGFVHSSVHQIGPEGQLLSEWWYARPRPEDDGLHAGVGILRRLLTGVNLVCCPSVAAFFDVGYLVQPLVAYRRHPQMETSRFLGARELEEAYRAKMLVLDKCADRIEDIDGLRRLIVRDHLEGARRGAAACWDEGQLEEATRYARFAEALGAGGVIGSAPEPAGGAFVPWVADPVSGRWRWSGAEVARTIPFPVLLKALCFKAAGARGRGWMDALQRIGRRSARRGQRVGPGQGYAPDRPQ